MSDGLCPETAATVPIESFELLRQSVTSLRRRGLVLTAGAGALEGTQCGRSIAWLRSSCGYEIACVIFCMAGTLKAMLRIFCEYSRRHAPSFELVSEVIDSIACA